MTSAHLKQVCHNTVWVIGSIMADLKSRNPVHSSMNRYITSRNILFILFWLVNTSRIGVSLSHITSVKREDINPIPQGNLQFAHHHRTHKVYG
jgi:hypothetical protein